MCSTYIFESYHILQNIYFFMHFFFVNIVNSENATCTNSMFRLQITQDSPVRLTVDTISLYKIYIQNVSVGKTGYKVQFKV